MSDCICSETPEKYRYYHAGILEPGSALEPNLECPAHFPTEPSHCRYCGYEIEVERHGIEGNGGCIPTVKRVARLRSIATPPPKTFDANSL